ncbi:MAG: SIMPL domain-containing protein [Treponema sp.]|nr:SIMPL domain-containing protein [Treponema sp.]
MKKQLKIISMLSISLLLLSCTINKPEERQKTITVSGSASVTLPSDLQVIEFVVTTSGWSAKLIVQDNDTITQRFVNAVKEVGVSEGDIQTTNCVITNPNNYESRRQVFVTVRNPALVPAIIDCKSGLIKLKNIRFETADTQSEVRRVRSLAIQNAQDAASLLAGASGSKIGEVTGIESDEIIETKTDDHKLILTSKVKVSYDLQ